MSLRLLNPDAFVGQVDGREVRLHVLRSAQMQAAICNHGARLLQLVVPDRFGQPRDVVLGHDSLAQLQTGMPSIGAFIGRYANRIGLGHLQIDGRAHQLPANEGPNCLHGGPGGSRHQVFSVLDHEESRLRLGWCFSTENDGFPGEVDLALEYEVDNTSLRISYAARVRRAATPLSLTCHPFFNLEGVQAPSALDHRLQILADAFVPVDQDRIPLGHLQPVAGTAFDFRQSRSVRDALAQDHAQLRLGAVPGFDHAFSTPGQPGLLSLQARLFALGSGIAMEVWSDAPSLQFYSGAALDGQLPRHTGKHGQVYRSGAALCLEPQQFPDAPNQPLFPPCIYRPGELLRGRIEYRFSIEDRPLRDE